MPVCDFGRNGSQLARKLLVSAIEPSSVTSQTIDAKDVALSIASAALLGGDLTSKGSPGLAAAVVETLRTLLTQGLEGLRWAVTLLRILASRSDVGDRFSPLTLPGFTGAALSVARCATQSVRLLWQDDDEVVLASLSCTFALLIGQGEEGLSLRNEADVVCLFQVTVGMLAQPLRAQYQDCNRPLSLALIPLSDALWAFARMAGMILDEAARGVLFRIAVATCTECLEWWACLAVKGTTPYSAAVVRVLWAAVSLCRTAADLSSLRKVICSDPQTLAPTPVLSTLLEPCWVTFNTVVSLAWVLVAVGFLSPRDLHDYLVKARQQSNGDSVSWPTPTENWTWALLWELVVLARVTVPGLPWPDVWLERAATSWREERAVCRGAVAGEETSKSFPHLLREVLKGLRVQHEMDAEVAAGPASRGVIVDAVLRNPRCIDDEQESSAGIWCLEVIGDSGALPYQGDPTLEISPGKLQVKSMLLDVAGCCIVYVPFALLQEEASISEKALADLLCAAGFPLPLQGGHDPGASTDEHTQIQPRDAQDTESVAMPQRATSVSNTSSMVANGVCDTLPSSLVDPKLATGTRAATLPQQDGESRKEQESNVASTSGQPSSAADSNAEVLGTKVLPDVTPTLELQQESVSDAGVDEVVQRRLDEASFRAERLARQRMEEAQRRAEEAQRRTANEVQRWREADGPGSEENDSKNDLFAANKVGKTIEDANCGNGEEVVDEAEDEQDDDAEEDEEEEEEEEVLQPGERAQDEEKEQDTDDRSKLLEAAAVGDVPDHVPKSSELDGGQWLVPGQTHPANVQPSAMRCASASRSAGSSSCESSAGGDESSSGDDGESSESEISDADAGVQHRRGQPPMGACGSGQGSCDRSSYAHGMQPQWSLPPTGQGRHGTWHSNHMNRPYPPAIEVPVDAGPPGNWGIDAPARRHEASPMPHFPQPVSMHTPAPPVQRATLASPQPAVQKPGGMASEKPPCADAEVLPPLVPQPGTVVVDFLAQDGKRRRVIRDSGLTMKALINLTPRGVRRICIADCVSAETHALLNRCPLQGRPTLHVVADSGGQLMG